LLFSCRGEWFEDVWCQDLSWWLCDCWFLSEHQQHKIDNAISGSDFGLGIRNLGAGIWQLLTAHGQTSDFWHWVQFSCWPKPGRLSAPNNHHHLLQPFLCRFPEFLQPTWRRKTRNSAHWWNSEICKFGPWKQKRIGIRWRSGSIFHFISFNPSNPCPSCYS
jgi:hypothetical protein